jgi:hypothetical protein
LLHFIFYPITFVSQSFGVQSTGFNLVKAIGFA